MVFMVVTVVFKASLISPNKKVKLSSIALLLHHDATSVYQPNRFL